MHKLSKTFIHPLTQIDLQNPQLQSTMQQLLQREQQFIHQKLLRQQEIDNRLKRLEKQYEQFTTNKEEKIKSKLEKSQKNRIQYIEKIVKKCKLKEKMYNEKIKNNNIKRKQSLREAWRQATEFNQKIHDQNGNSKNSFSRGRSLEQYKQLQNKTMNNPNTQKIDHINATGQQNLSKSIMLGDGLNEGNMNVSKNNLSSQTANSQLNAIRAPVHMTSSKNHTRPLQQLLTSKHNNMKSSQHAAFQSTFHIQKKPSSRLPKAINTSSHRVLQSIQTNQNKLYYLNHGNGNYLESNDCTNAYEENGYQEKLRKTLIRHKEHLQQQQNKKIQQCGERLQKIHLSRRKRDSLQKQKLKNNLSDKQMQYYDQNNQQPNTNKKSNPFLNSKSQRIKSQNHTYDRNKRTSNWSDSNKQRRQKMLMAHIEHGNQYLSQNRIRHLKQVVSRSLVYNTIEKKLFMERLRSGGVV